MTPALELVGISKSFDGFMALSGASFAVLPGEVHALLGENGAGKSSLMNVAAGLYAPDEGQIFVNGERAVIRGPNDAKAVSIGMVHQHFKLVKPFDALENIFLFSPRGSYKRGLREIEAEVRRHSDEVGFELDLRRPVGSLSIAEQQRVEILKVLVGGARILILDEPTAVLSDMESERLLKTLRGVAGRGTAVVLVTHKLREVIAHADRVTVMRGGKTIATTDPRKASVADLTQMVVGSTVTERPAPSEKVGAPMLTVTDLRGERPGGHMPLIGASFTVRSGEIYGIAGVDGNGQTVLAEILMGVLKPLGGRIEMNGAGSVTNDGAEKRRTQGLVSIPADRQAYGLAGDLSVAENYAVSGVLAGSFGSWLRVHGNRVRAVTREAVTAFDVQGVRSTRQKAALLSGGNAQKLVIAREFAGRPRVVLAHSPSRGLDVRAAAAVHQRLREARDAGAGVLLISEDLDEILLLSDLVGVMNRGRIVAEFPAPADRHAVGRAIVHHE
jgi:general nucleoside transport system ATP-binding protein